MVSMRQNMVWGAIAFGVTLALVVGLRLDKAALTVVVGVACGIGASIPTGLLVVYVMRRRHTGEAERRRARGVAGSPPVVVVAPPAAPQLPQPAGWSGPFAAPTPVRREFAVIGEEGVDSGQDYWQD
jgi:hypothetical protein